MPSLRSFSDFVGSFWAGFFFFFLFRQRSPDGEELPSRCPRPPQFAGTVRQRAVGRARLQRQYCRDARHQIQSMYCRYHQVLITPPLFFLSVFNSSAKPKLLSINNSPELFWVANFLIYLFIPFLFFGCLFFLGAQLAICFG